MKKEADFTSKCCVSERLYNTPRDRWHTLFGLSKPAFDKWWGPSDIPPWSRKKARTASIDARVI